MQRGATIAVRIVPVSVSLLVECIEDAFRCRAFQSAGEPAQPVAERARVNFFRPEEEEKLSWWILQRRMLFERLDVSKGPQI